MSKFDRILSDDEVDNIAKNTTMLLGRSIARSKDFILKVEQAVLAKLSEQEPVAYLYADEVYGSGDSDINDYIRANGDPLYAHPMPCVSTTIDKTACVSESEESDIQSHLDYIKRYQKWRRGEDKTMTEAGLEPKQIGEALDWLITFAENHIADASKMVADMYWIDPDYPSYTSILDAFDPIHSSVEVEVGDRYEVSSAKTLPTLTIEVTELEENGDVKDFKVLSGDHIVSNNKMVTPLAQRKIQTLLDRGEYRVIENATVLVNENGHAAIVNKGGAFYWVDNEALAREFDAGGEGSKGSGKQCKMVWCACGDGFEADTFGAGFIAARGHCQGCDAEDKSSVLAESKAKIMAAADWLADVCVMQIRGTETDKDVAEAYKALEMRVAAELAIAQERANKEPEGWQLIPKEPTMDMIKALLETIVTTSKGGVVNPKTTLTYALAAAPKYTGESKMTQRYKFTTQLAPTLDGDYDVVTIAVPDDQGDYVRHDAVSHLIEEKTIEQHRSEFEQWAAKEGLRMTRRSDGKYVAPFTAIAWRTWLAAKGENNDI